MVEALEGSQYLTLKTDTQQGIIAQAALKQKLAEKCINSRSILQPLLDNTTFPFTQTITNTQFDFFTAATGLSKKSCEQFHRHEVINMLNDLICVEQLVCPMQQQGLIDRYLMSKGESIGGELRNLVGQIGEDKVIKAIFDVHPHLCVTHSKTGKIQSIGNRIFSVHFNRKPKLIGKSVDIIVLHHPDNVADLEDPKQYYHAGEIKSGIDPAGADEHWKTACTAFSRIRDVFQEHDTCPALGFLGASINKNMIGEMQSQLAQGTLHSISNLNRKEQVAAWVQFALPPL
jgi:type II restriction enzyme